MTLLPGPLRVLVAYGDPAATPRNGQTLIVEAVAHQGVVIAPVHAHEPLCALASGIEPLAHPEGRDVSRSPWKGPGQVTCTRPIQSRDL